MKGSELIRLLKKHGCFITRHRSNHDEWYSPITKNPFMVPRHFPKEIKNGTANQILKDAGIK